MDRNAAPCRRRVTTRAAPSRRRIRGAVMVRMDSPDRDHGRLVSRLTWGETEGGSRATA
jgi:hypothetical protein